MFNSSCFWIVFEQIMQWLSDEPHSGQNLEVLAISSLQSGQRIKDDLFIGLKQTKKVIIFIFNSI
jgi:hypothetical protein